MGGGMLNAMSSNDVNVVSFFFGGCDSIFGFIAFFWSSL